MKYKLLNISILDNYNFILPIYGGVHFYPVLKKLKHKMTILLKRFCLLNTVFLLGCFTFTFCSLFKVIGFINHDVVVSFFSAPNIYEIILLHPSKIW